MRAALLTLVAAVALCCPAAVQARSAVPAPQRAQLDPNPCLGPEAPLLRCPDLVMRRPFGLYADHYTERGRTLLRAGNAIDSAGAGPAELHGTRIGPRFMSARQAIYLIGRGRLFVETGARLQFKYAHQRSFWWKFHQAARFELRRVDRRGRPGRLVRTGPKVSYCLRDLFLTRPLLPGSPQRLFYPACSTNRRARRVRLGTSVGWADVYPATYPEQWIDVTGLRGCFAYVHTADPENGIYESDEDNNQAQVIVRLPFRAKARRKGCRGEDLGRGYNPVPRRPNRPY